MNFRKIIGAFNGVFKSQHRDWARYALVTNETPDLLEVMCGDEL